jgi:protein-disulfide isomerase
MEAVKLSVPVDESRDHIRGAPTASVTLVEYGDFECPHCGQAHYILNDLMSEFEDQLRLVFRHFPLTQLHPHAQHAAEAAESSGAQNRFWEMHDLMFENQEALDDKSLLSFADALGLDANVVARDLAEGRYTSRVRQDISSGVHSGVNGTPSFFINGVRHDGPWDLASLSAAIAAHIADDGGRGDRPKRARGQR